MANKTKNPLASPPSSMAAPATSLTVPWGPQLMTKIGAAALHKRGPDSISFVAPSHIAVLLLTPQPARETALASSRRRMFDAPAGTVEIMPAGADFYGRWSVAKENLFFSYEPRVLARLALEEFGVDGIEIFPPGQGHADDDCHSIAKLLRQELSQGECANALCVESLTLLFAMRMLRRYSSSGVRRKAGLPGSGGLSTHSRRIVLEYMHDRISERIGIGDLAAEVRLSPGYFLRAFKQSFGQTPHQYLIDIRIDLAERLVLQSELPLSLVAEMAGFANQSHLTAELRRRRGYTPRQLRNLPHRCRPEM